MTTKLETDLDSKPSTTPVAVKRPNRPSIASNNSSSSQSGPAKRKCVDPLEAGPSGSAKEEFVTIPDEDENNAVAPKMEPEFVNESMWDDDDDGANNEETNFGEDDSNMEMTGFDGSTTGDGNITGGGEGGAVGDAQDEQIEQLPEWTSIYFIKVSDSEMKCNLCEVNLKTDEKSLDLLDHLKNEHKDIYDLHKDNPEATVGFRIEFLHLNVLKDDEDAKTQPVILGEVCETTTETIAEKEEEINVKSDDANLHFVLLDGKATKKSRRESAGPRKRSWVWKYFDKLSNIIYRCKLCHVVLSIKGCNSNNMNRHVRSRHPTVFKSEVAKRDKVENVHILTSETDTPYAIKTEEIYASDRDFDITAADSPTQKLRRSWIWSYFDRVSTTQARCKLCERHICHGGNATGNMNRHLKMIHNKTAINMPGDMSWVWKVFEAVDNDFYCCKICQYKCLKCSDVDKDMNAILSHLKLEHGVISGDQIITGADVENEETC